MTSDISWSTVILVIALLFMHMLTLTAMMYKDCIGRFCDGVSTEALKSELARRANAERTRYREPMISAAKLVDPNVGSRYAPYEYTPTYGQTSLSVASCGGWQEPINSVYGRELRMSEGTVGQREAEFDPYRSAASMGSRDVSCKNQNTFNF